MEPSSRSGVKGVNIDLQKQQQVRARPCPASTLRSPPLQLPPETSHITCVSIIPTQRESTLGLFTGGMAASATPICHPVRSSTTTCRCAHTPSQPSPACLHGRSLSGPHACSHRRSNFSKHREKDVRGEIFSSDMPSDVVQDPAFIGAASGAGAARRSSGRRPPIDEPLPAGAAQLASVVPWTDGALGFVYFERVCVWRLSHVADATIDEGATQ